ncbi:hypothetical protein LJC46_00995 [Desulfovibrio sp. OttesenSCG-928-G15]|nr:hypothetical protein [Desulfovibrio sp. OttesenSCG-928-G15]
MNTHNTPVRLTASIAFAIMLLFVSSVKSEAFDAGTENSPNASQYAVTIDDRELFFVFPAGYAPASKKVADAVQAMYQSYTSDMQVWTFTRPEIEKQLLQDGADKRIQSYVALTHIPEAENSYTRKDFREVLKDYAQRHEAGKKTLEEFREQLVKLAPALDMRAEVQSGQTSALWLSAVDSVESTAQKRDIMLTAELLMRKNTRAIMVFLFRFYHSPQDLDDLMQDVESFKQNIEP